MNANSARYCPCGTRLARDNPNSRCASCQAKTRDLVARPPDVPAEFWTTDHMRDALATWHMGRVIAAYRKHPFHGPVLRQEIVAGWMGITQAQLSRIESGPPIKDLDKLTSKLIADGTLSPAGSRMFGLDQLEFPSWTATFGVSFAFIAVMMAISCWWFSRRDY